MTYTMNPMGKFNEQFARLKDFPEEQRKLDAAWDKAFAAGMARALEKGMKQSGIGTESHSPGIGTESHSEHHSTVHIDTGDQAHLTAAAGYSETTGKDHYHNVGFGATAEESASAHAGIGSTAGDYIGATIGEKAGADIHGTASYSDHGASISAGGFIGDAATVTVDGDVKYHGMNAHYEDGVSFGDDVGASLSGKINFGHSKIKVEVGGKIAALVGVHGKVSISIDTKPLEHDYNDVVHTYDDIKKGIDREEHDVSHDVSHDAHDVEHAFTSIF